MKARYNYRIYPKPHQIEPLAKAFGCARVVWNDALWLYNQANLERQPIPKDVDKKVITQAKKTEKRSWLAEVSNIVLQQSIRDLQQAWNNYFSSLKGKRKGKKLGRPKFKKKQSRQAIRFRKGGFTVHSTSIKLAKIGHVPIVYSRPLPSAPSSVTIIKDTAGRYFASFVVEINPENMPKTDKSVGIDLGLTHFAILSDGEKIENPKLHKKMLRRLKKANRRLSKALKDSNRRKSGCDRAVGSLRLARAPSRRKLSLAKLHAKVKDSRNDFLQKLSTRLVRENQAIAIEDLNVSGMVKKRCDPAEVPSAKERAPRHRKLSRAISDAGWYSFRSLLDAKCEKYGRDFVVIHRWEATSQKCSACGFPGGKKELNIRAWTCWHCGAEHDRDINAAKNILVAGRLSETLNGRGSKSKTSNEAICDEPSTTSKVVQLNLF